MDQAVREMQRLLGELHEDAHRSRTRAQVLEAKRKFATAYPQQLRELRTAYSLPVVPIKGSRPRGLRAGYFWTPLPDGTKGFLQRRVDDCVQMALATLTQIPPWQVPDAHIDERMFAGDDPDDINRDMWLKLGQWSDARGFDIKVHAVKPGTLERWIGVIPRPGAFQSHCVLMQRGACIFEPHAAIPGPPPQDALGRIAYAITTQPKAG
jgi:hypothetical protein